ncbi:serine hydrolase domain-containing protein [Paenibacillus larvae]|uniref:serine hydrolase n=1 Tax=Paenibacillus larvae TaxID=1464 RepID=UPI002029F486|nr:serine hydrolase [Paenibacillus larvae]
MDTKADTCPLGMQNTYLTLEEVKQTENYALPYVKVDGQNTEIPFSTDVAGTAGALQTSVADLAKWVSFQLNQGNAKENRLISKERLAKHISRT